jgi:hypothetical protein
MGTANDHGYVEICMYGAVGFKQHPHDRIFRLDKGLVCARNGKLVPTSFSRSFDDFSLRVRCWLVDKPAYLRYVLTHAWRFLFITIEVRLSTPSVRTMLKGPLDMSLYVYGRCIIIRKKILTL